MINSSDLVIGKTYRIKIKSGDKCRISDLEYATDRDGLVVKYLGKGASGSCTTYDFKIIIGNSYSRAGDKTKYGVQFLTLPFVNSEPLTYKRAMEILKCQK